MIARLVGLLRPLIEPLLKLRMDAPRLPEGQYEVRHQKPAAQYLAYRYVAITLGALGGLFALAPLAALALMKLDTVAGVAIAAAVVVLVLAVATFALVEARLDWELRDYLVGDRSLRVREGAWVQREITLSFANVQNVEIAQGPLERLFGFKSLRVSTAGGSGGGDKDKRGDDAHQAVLVGLANADELRVLIVDSMRRERGGGLGDPEEAHRDGGEARIARLEEVLDAARELRVAARGAGTPERREKER